MSSRMIAGETETKDLEMEKTLSVLPVRWDLKATTLFSLLIGVLTAAASLFGILFPNELYPTAEMRESFFPNDIVNLAIGLPILIGSIWLTRRGVLLGLLFWPGALFYGLYNYLAYLFALPLTIMYPIYLLIVTLSIYTTIGVAANINSELVKNHLRGRVPERLSGGVLMGLGILFILLGASVMAGGVADGGSVSRPELALVVTDFIVSAAWIVGGFMLWRQLSFGYAAATGLLFQGSMLFIGLILIFFLQPLISDAPLLLTDIVTVFVMGLLCFIPFGLFLRGVIQG